MFHAQAGVCTKQEIVLSSKHFAHRISLLLIRKKSRRNRENVKPIAVECSTARTALPMRWDGGSDIELYRTLV